MDTVYSKAWAAANPQLYHTFAQPPEACPVCFQSFTEENPAKSPLLGECALACRHFAYELYELGGRFRYSRVYETFGPERSNASALFLA